MRQAFLEAPLLSKNRGAAVAAANHNEGVAFMIQHGAAYGSITVPDGRRTIVDVFLPTDIGGIGDSVMGHSEQEIIAASSLSYRAISSDIFSGLMRNHQVALRVLALLAEQRRRLDHHVMALARFHARERICSFVIGIYDRLWRSELISRPTFNLPLNQDQMADHLGMTIVHVSRTLRRLREERLLLIDRQVAIILNVDAVRMHAKGSRPAAASALPGGSADAGDLYPSSKTAFASELKSR